MSVKAKVTLLIVGLSLLSGVVGTKVIGELFERHVERSASESLDVAAREFAAQERSEIEKLSAALDMLLPNDELARAFMARDRKRLLELAAPLFETMKARDRITHWYFIDPAPAKTVFLRVHRPELHSDVVERATLAKAIASGDTGSGKELGQTAFALRVVHPWFHKGKLIGYMELAEEIDHFLATMKSRTRDEYGMLVKKQYLDEKSWARIIGDRANTWNDRPDVVVIDTTIFNLGITDFQGDLADIPDGGRTLDEILGDDKAWIRGIFPIRDAADRKVGALFVLHDFTPMHRAVRSGIVQTLFVMVAFSLATAFALVLAVRSFVFDRLEALLSRLEKGAADGDLPPGRVVRAETHDTVARIEGLCERFLDAASRRPRSVRPPDDRPREPAA